MKNEKLTNQKEKMTKRIFPAFFFISLLIFCVSCQNLFESPKSVARTGFFSLRLTEQGTGRTIMPEAMQNFAWYKLEFTAANGAGQDLTKWLSGSDASQTIELEPGTYNLVVTAYTDNDQKLAAARGESLSPVEISAGRTTDIFINIGPIVAEDETGTFSWEITYPANVTTASMTITPYPEGDSQIWYFAAGTTSANTGANTKAKTDTLTLASGSYWVVFDLAYTDGSQAQGREILHVYANLDSAFKQNFNEKYFINNNNDNTPPLFSVSGEFDTGDMNPAVFKVSTVGSTTPSTGRSARSVSGASQNGNIYELSGELEDGDILFRLTGTYDASSGEYTMSAAASFVRYTINGDSKSAIATLAVRDRNGNWESFIVDVKVTDQVTLNEDLEIEEDPDFTEAGIPSWAWGNNMFFQWEEDGNWGEGNATISQWYITTDSSGSWDGWLSNNSQSYTVIESASTGNDTYAIIFAYPEYIATDIQGQAAAKQFFIDNGLAAELWERSGNPWDEDNASYVTNWEVVFYNFANGEIDIKSGWDVNRAVYQKWWDNDYLNKYLVRNYDAIELDATTWYTKIQFSHVGSDITLRFYDGEEEAGPGKPGGNSTSLSTVQALTNADLYYSAGRSDYEERYNTAGNPVATQKPLNLYAKNGAGWATTIGNVIGWYEGRDSNLGLANSYVIQTVSMDYTPWNNLVMQFSNQLPANLDLVLKLTSGNRDNSGNFNEYTGGLGSWNHFVKSTQGNTYTFDYIDALYEALTVGVGVWGNADTGTSFDIQNIYQISIEADGQDIGNYIEKIWLEFDEWGRVYDKATLPTAPTLTGTVTITGAAQAGYTLSANTSDLKGTGTISYQWNRGDEPITRANASTYVLTDDDVDNVLTVTVTRAGYAGSVTSEPTGQVQPASTDTTQVTGSITVTQGTADAITVSFTNTDALVLPESGSITVTVSGSYSTYQWFVDSVLNSERGSSLTLLNGGQYTTGTHRILVIVYSSDGVPYSKQIEFTVE